jgi:hypothetical protein
MEFVNLALGSRGFPVATTTLDGRTFRVQAVWNGVESSWGVTLFDSSGTQLTPALVVRHGQNVLGSLSNPNLPPGKLGAWDTSNNQRDPGRDDLRKGSDVRLIYIPAAEVS